MINLQIGYKFKDMSILETALTHVSFSHDNNVESYDRMEYLGDSILQLIVSEYLYNNYPQLESGELSKYRSHLVSTKNLSRITKSLHFDKYIRIGRALNKVSDALMADLFESVLAAIYLDGGMAPAKKFVMNYVIINNDNIDAVVNEDYDYKTALQEYAQSLENRPNLQYKLINTTMQNNENFFTMQILADGEILAEVTDKSKKICEKRLSRLALMKFKNTPFTNE